MTVLLVVDDDDDIREALCGALTVEGYVVITARDGIEALDRLHGFGGMPRPDIVILDIMMPGMNGWGFLQVKDSDPDVQGIPVILLTAMRSDTVREGDTRGACLIVHKPVALEKLLAVLRCVRTRSIPPPAAAGA